MESLKDDKYITILDAKPGQLEELIKLSKDDHWKPIFHIHPECGLLNDPNGLAHFNGEYHVFYQWFPFGAIHGMKHWAHVKSTDLIHWERMPVAIIPTEDYEKHGAYSGSAIEKDGELLLFYTGNIKYSTDNRDANQCLAIMNKNYEITKKCSSPVITGVPAGYTGHVRDPKVWSLAGKYYMIIGAQRKNLTGALLIYESIDAKVWSLKGELNTGLTNFGYMWECPDHFTVDGKDVLMFSPQGLVSKGHDYQNLYNVIYAVGKLDIDKLTFTIEHMSELDKGFDFYAPQTFEDSAGRRILLGWAGAAENQYPTEKKHWSHCLTLPRQIVFEDNIIKQKPVVELAKLRKDNVELSGTLDNNSVVIDSESNSYELNIELNTSKTDNVSLKLFKSVSEEFILKFDVKNNVVSINRQKFINAIGNEIGYARTAELNSTEKITGQIFVDNSIIEIFLNSGEAVFTARAFPQEAITSIELSATGKTNYTINKYNIARGI